MPACLLTPTTMMHLTSSGVVYSGSRHWLTTCAALQPLTTRSTTARIGNARDVIAALLSSWYLAVPVTIHSRGQPAMVKEYFFIVARRVPRMYEEMQRSFAGLPHIQVILDRRRRERRWQVIPIE